jgi:hypothetical protein
MTDISILNLSISPTSPIFSRGGGFLALTIDPDEDGNILLS